MGEEVTKPAHNEQKYKQHTSVRFDSYEDAVAVRRTYGKGRHRIRRRPGGYYDLITYTEV